MIKFKKIKDENITPIIQSTQNITFYENIFSPSINEKSKSPRDNLKVINKLPEKNPTFSYSADLFLPITSKIIEKNKIRIEKNTMKILKSKTTSLTIVTI